MTHLTDVQKTYLREQLLAMRMALQARSEAAAEETRPVSLDQPMQFNSNTWHWDSNSASPRNASKSKLRSSGSLKTDMDYAYGV